MKKIFFTTFNLLKEKKYIIKFFEEIKDEVIIFLDKENNIKIFASICPHFGGKIFYEFNHNKLICKWHNWKFCTHTGRCLTYPIKGKLNPYEFKIDPNPLKNYDVNIENNKIYLIYEN